MSLLLKSWLKIDIISNELLGTILEPLSETNNNELSLNIQLTWESL